MTGNNNSVRSLFLAALVVFSVFAGSIAFAGGAAAQDNTLNNGDVVFVGQTVSFSGATGAEGYTLVDNDGTFIREYTSNSFDVNTESLDPGTYTLRAQGDGVDSETTFTVAEQTLSADFETLEDDSTVLQLNSNRGSYMVSVTSDDTDVNALFAETDAKPETEGLQIAAGDGQLAVDSTALSELSQGEYEFDITVPDTGANATATLGAGVTPEDSVEFNQSVYTADRGDIAEITIDFNGESSTFLTIGNQETVGYEQTIEITDTGDDGQATVRFNTYNGNYEVESGTLETADANIDAIDVLDVADYDMSLSQTADGSSETDVGTLAVSERSTGSFGVAVASGSQSYEDVSAVVNASVDSNSVAPGDVVVHRLEATGLEGVLAAQDGGSDATSQFFDLVTDTDDDTDTDTDGTGTTDTDTDSDTDSALASLTIEQTNPGPNQDAATVDIENSESAFTVLSQNGEYYILLDTDELTLNGDASLAPGQNYNVSFTMPADSGLVEEDTTLTTDFDVVEGTLSLDTQEVDGEDRVVVRAEDNQTISGESSYAAGTQVRVVVRSTGDNPFLLDDTATIQKGGTFNATFDFSDYSSNTTFTVDADGQGVASDASADATGVINPARSGDVSVSDQEGDGSNVTVDSVSLSEGGFVAIYNSTDGDATSSVIGTSEYLDAGEHSDVTVDLDTPLSESGTVYAVPHMDSNGNQQYDFVSSNGSEDGPYTSGGSAVTDSAEYSVVNATAGNNSSGNGTTTPNGTTGTPTATPGTPGTPTTGTTSGGTTQETTAGTTSSGDGPGFGVIVALVALVAAALLAVRRDN